MVTLVEINNIQRLNIHKKAQAEFAKSLQSYPTLCNPIDGSPPGSPVPGILQARTLEWVAISFSNAWKWKVKVKSLSRVQLLATSWTAAYQAPPSMGFPRQEYWSGVPLCLPRTILFLYFRFYHLLIVWFGAYYLTFLYLCFPGCKWGYTVSTYFKRLLW